MRIMIPSDVAKVAKKLSEIVDVEGTTLQVGGDLEVDGEIIVETPIHEIKITDANYVADDDIYVYKVEKLNGLYKFDFSETTHESNFTIKAKNIFGFIGNPLTNYSDIDHYLLNSSEYAEEGYGEISGTIAIFDTNNSWIVYCCNGLVYITQTDN